MKKAEKKNQDRYFVNLSTRNKHDDKIFMQINYGAKNGDNVLNDILNKSKIISKKSLAKIEDKINVYMDENNHLDAEIQIDGIYEILENEL
jgi:hypothetical protein